jgi:hypothetical protein
MVDPAEFQSVAAGASGTLGSGVIYEVQHGDSYAGKLPTSSNSNGISGTSANNLIALGTADNPIQISGTVAIDGDLVISGVIKGDGAIIASGNIYVLGDLTYADGSDANKDRTLGIAADGTTNGLAMAAGGNVIAGDYLTDNGQIVAGDGTGAFNFTMSELTIFNRAEWTKTQAQLKDASGKLVANPLYQPGYKARYYVMGNDDPVFIFNDANSSRPKVYFDVTTETWKGSEHAGNYGTPVVKYAKGDPVYDQATILTLGTGANWLPETTMVGFWGEADALHSSGTPKEIDALLYSNNSAWTCADKDSVYAGHLTLNGGLIAADTGVRVTPKSGNVGLQLNYDARQADKFHLKQPGGPLAITRALWLPRSN